MIATLRARAHRDERGFTLVEAAAAMGVVFVALVLLAGLTAGAARDIGFARQRQGANQIANQLLEEVRGLAYDTLKKGLSTSELAGDPNIKDCGGTYYLKVCPSSDPDAEKVVSNTGLSNVTPLVPHQGSYGPPLYPSTYSWSVYVTEAVGVPESGAFRVTAIVSWANAQRKGLANSVEVQTLVFSPEGCTSPSTHPFAAPCEVYFRGFGSVDPGSVVTTGTVGGVLYDSMIVHLPAVRADVQHEQVIVVAGHSRLPGGELIRLGVSTPAGLTIDTSTADKDPSTPAGHWESNSTTLQTGGIASAGDGTNELRVSVTGSDGGGTTAAVTANTANPCNSQNDGKPCGYSHAQQNGGVTETLTLGSTIGTATLVEAGTQSSPSTAYGHRSPGGSAGWIRETVVRRLPTVTLGGLPSGIPEPVGWAGYWVRVSGYQVTTLAEAGLGTVTPSVSFGGGTVEMWNGTGYTSVPIDAAGDTALSIEPVSVSFLTGLGSTTTVEISGSLSIEPSFTSEDIITGSERSFAEAVAGPPLAGTIDYDVSTNGVPNAALDLEVDLGATFSRTAYEPAPGA